MLIQEREDTISLLCKGTDNKALWPWATAGQTMGTLLSRALCTSGLNRLILSGIYSCSNISTATAPKIFARTTSTFIYQREKQDVSGWGWVHWKHRGNRQGLCVSSVTQDFPQVGYPRKEGTEEVKDNWTLWFLWADCITQPSLTRQGLPPLLSGALHYQRCQIGMAPIQVQICWHSLPLSKDKVYPNFTCA